MNSGNLLQHKLLHHYPNIVRKSTLHCPLCCKQAINMNHHDGSLTINPFVNTLGLQNIRCSRRIQKIKGRFNPNLD